MNLEQQIVDEVLAGRTDRFSYIVRTYGAKVFALTVRMLPCREDAEDLTQEVMVKVYASLGSFRRGSSLSTWIYRIAYTTAISHMRRLTAELPLDEARLSDVADDAVDSLLDAPADSAREMALLRAIERLSADERALITLHYYNNLPLADVSQITGLSLSNVKVKLMRTRRKLYLLITDEENKSE